MSEQSYHADQKPPTEELDCFMDGGRVCGPSCVAFTSTTSAEANKVRGRCFVLTSLGQIATSLISIKQKVTQPGIPKVL